MKHATRRHFMRVTGIGLGQCLAPAAQQSRSIAIVSPPPATGEPLRRAISELQRALQVKGVAAEIRGDLFATKDAGEVIAIVPPGSAIAGQIAVRAGVRLPDAPESLALIAGQLEGRRVLLVTGSDTRGQVYGALEVADRIRHSTDPIGELRSINRVIEQPANPIRSVARLFVSDVEDKPWFYDKSFWTPYLSFLVAQRFNRFSLTLGLGYDLPKRVLDAYFIFAYPYLLSVPGYRVTVRGLPAGEPERNLAMLKWISEEAAALGLHFQLGLWSHTYELIDSPKANYTIEGLTPGNHGAYCRDALRMLLRECPAIGGVTVRAHSESGIPDGSYAFWQTVFQGVKECGRRVELDLHSKGIDFRQIRMAIETGQPVRISPKLTAEHGGLPAHQIAIRERERRQASSTPQERSFTRYGYADYLAEDRDFGVYFRLWPGQQKLLLWGDPAIAAGYGRSAAFCGSLGLEYCEPLSFKGRQGSGQSPERRIYVDNSLRPAGGDWRKYEYTYRLWGRLLYDPAADASAWRRYLRSEFGTAAEPVERSLAASSRALPLFTSAHLPSGAGMSYWPELYTNMPIADLNAPHPFGDTPSPKNFGHVSPLDPGLFCSAAEMAEQLAGRASDGRYTPADVAGWLESLAGESGRQWSAARASTRDGASPGFRRVEVDVHAANALARFWAQKMRAAVAWSVYEKNGDATALRDAVYFYRLARAEFARLVGITRPVYVAELAFGATPQLRGHWADRLPAIDRDLAYMERQLGEKTGGSSGTTDAPSAAARRWLAARPAAPACQHVPPAVFRSGEALPIELTTPAQVTVVRLHYRHVNQAEEYNAIAMEGAPAKWRQSIPSAYTESRFSLLYYFELHGSDGSAWLYPGLQADLSNQPYYVVRRAKSRA